MYKETIQEASQMKLVVIESPYAGDIDINVGYARQCMKHCLDRGEAPIASHLLYTQEGILRDAREDERMTGIQAGFHWGAKADLIAVYTDLGISEGMRKGIDVYRYLKIPIEFRSLHEPEPMEED